jgi:hypothetical protein
MPAVAAPGFRRGCELLHRVAAAVRGTVRSEAGAVRGGARVSDDRAGRVMSWYVLYKERAVNALERLDDRDSALSTAFALAHGGHELIELGRIGDGAEAIAGPAMARLLADYAGGEQAA